MNPIIVYVMLFMPASCTAGAMHLMLINEGFTIDQSIVMTVALHAIVAFMYSKTGIE